LLTASFRTLTVRLSGKSGCKGTAIF